MPFTGGCLCSESEHSLARRGTSGPKASSDWTDKVSSIKAWLHSSLPLLPRTVQQAWCSSKHWIFCFLISLIWRSNSVPTEKTTEWAFEVGALHDFSTLILMHCYLSHWFPYVWLLVLKFPFASTLAVGQVSERSLDGSCHDLGYIMFILTLPLSVLRRLTLKSCTKETLKKQKWFCMKKTLKGDLILTLMYNQL